eukprot:2574019-Amphidinium_carterae.2
MLPPPLHAMGLPPPSFPPWAHYPAAAHGCPAGYVLTPHATLPNQKSCNGASLPEDPGSLSVPGGLRKHVLHKRQRSRYEFFQAGALSDAS